jgi:hypothetical protein
MWDYRRLLVGGTRARAGPIGSWRSYCGRRRYPSSQGSGGLAPTVSYRPCSRGRGGVGLRGRGKIPLPSRQADAGFVTVAAGVRLLPFATFDWIDIVDAAPIPLGVNLGATRHRQMIEQGGQGAFRAVHKQ